MNDDILFFNNEEVKTQRDEILYRAMEKETVSSQCKYLYRYRWSHVYREELQSKSFDMAKSHYARYQDISKDNLPILSEIYDSIVDWIFSYRLSSKQSIIKSVEIRDRIKFLIDSFEIKVVIKNIISILFIFGIPVSMGNIKVNEYWISKETEISNGMILSYKQSHKTYNKNIIIDNDYPIYGRLFK